MLYLECRRVGGKKDARKDVYADTNYTENIPYTGIFPVRFTLYLKIIGMRVLFSYRSWVSTNSQVLGSLAICYADQKAGFEVIQIDRLA